MPNQDAAALDTLNGLCPAGKATLLAHNERIKDNKQRLDNTDRKLDRITWLVITTLVAAVLNLVPGWLEAIAK